MSFNHQHWILQYSCTELQQYAKTLELEIWWWSANNLEPGSRNVTGFHSLQGSTGWVKNGSLTPSTHRTGSAVTGCSWSASCQEKRVHCEQGKGNNQSTEGFRRFIVTNIKLDSKACKWSYFSAATSSSLLQPPVPLSNHSKGLGDLWQWHRRQ